MEIGFRKRQRGVVNIALAVTDVPTYSDGKISLGDFGLMADAEDERIEALEARIAYQDQTIEELNQSITEQWKIIDLLTKKLSTLEEQVRSGSYIADPASEKPPPHY
ncbi:SlyX family protein [Devosia rhizoryzae]